MNQEISDSDRLYLLKLARLTINNNKTKNILSENDISSLSPVLMEKRGCFVTLTINNNLRGCIGYILPIQKLYQTVIDNSYNAAFQDPRFNPVSKQEIPELHIEISVLTVPQKLNYSDSKDLLNKLNPLIDGLIIKKGYRNATFLPQVWEQLPAKEDFLTHLCLKAGLSPDEWIKSDLEIETYKAEIFEEEK